MYMKMLELYKFYALLCFMLELYDFQVIIVQKLKWK